MSEPRVELDKSGKGCTVYTAIVNSKLIRDCQTRPQLRNFLMEMALQHVEVKANILLSRDVKILKRKFIGTLHEQHIRSTRDALVAEVPDPKTADGFPPRHANVRNQREKKKAKIEVVPTEIKTPTQESPDAENSLKEPEFQVLKEPEENPDFLCLEIQLPQARNMRSATLDIGARKVLFVCEPFGYKLSTRLPYPVMAKDGGAQFDKGRHVLTVTLPVVK